MQKFKKSTNIKIRSYFFILNKINWAAYLIMTLDSKKTPRKTKNLFYLITKILIQVLATFNGVK